MKKRNKLDIHGVLNIDKPSGMTSHDVISILRKTLNMTSIGHTGTLDPLATGVLPICLGNATKLSERLICDKKKYKVGMLLGIQTDTYDITGEIKNSSVVSNIDAYKLTDVIMSFVGPQKQVPPIYSAIKLNGRKSYELARKGIDVEIPSREIEIYNIDNIKISKDDCKVYFDVECSKGTYIRSLCNDIGIKLGTYGTLTELRRTKSGIFDIENSTKLDDFIKLPIDKLISKIISLDILYKTSPLKELTNSEHFAFINGKEIPMLDMELHKNCSNIIRIYYEGKFIGLGTLTNSNLKRYIVV